MSIRRYGPIDRHVDGHTLRFKISNVATMRSTLVGATDGAHVRDIEERTRGVG